MQPPPFCSSRGCDCLPATTASRGARSIWFSSRRDYGSGAESVTLNKQRRLSKTALHYLQHHPDYQGHEIRFDVLSARQQGGQFQLEWIQEAFWPAEL
jgi:Holliday junction resolvase-like predicted endonuclease